MKKLFFYALAGLFMTTVLFSCHRKEDEDNSGNNAAGSATVTMDQFGFDGKNSGKFSSTKAGIVKTSAGGVNTLTISAVRDGGTESVNIVLSGDLKVQSYSLGNGSQNVIVLKKDYQNTTDQTMSYSTNNSSNNQPGGGELKITSINGNKIEGTFYCWCYNNSKGTAFVEQGKFSGAFN